MSNQEKDSGSAPLTPNCGSLIVDESKSQEKIERETRERQQHEFARAQVQTNQRIALFTFFLVVGTFVSIGVGIFQLMNATTTTQTDERAWVATSLAQSWPPDESNMRVAWTNFGKTPAIGVKATFVVDACATVPEERFRYTDLKPFGELSPNQAFFLIVKTYRDCDGTVRPIDYRSMFAKETPLVIHGRIEYRDIFSHDHWFEMCAVAVKEAKNQFVPCESDSVADPARHNKSDTP